MGARIDHLRACPDIGRRLTAAAALCLVLAAGFAAAAESRALRVGCEKPRLLRLVRYEDGSARLYCGDRVLVRVSVPY